MVLISQFIYSNHLVQPSSNSCHEVFHVKPVKSKHLRQMAQLSNLMSINTFNLILKFAFLHSSMGQHNFFNWIHNNFSRFFFRFPSTRVASNSEFKSYRFEFNFLSLNQYSYLLLLFCKWFSFIMIIIISS